MVVKYSKTYRPFCEWASNLHKFRVHLRSIHWIVEVTSLMMHPFMNGIYIHKNNMDIKYTINCVSICERVSIFAKTLWVIHIMDPFVNGSQLDYYINTCAVCVSPVRSWECNVALPHFFHEHKELHVCLVSCTKYLTSSLLECKVANALYAFLCSLSVRNNTHCVAPPLWILKTAFHLLLHAIYLLKSWMVYPEVDPEISKGGAQLRC